jgi:NADH-quinone oxidoreductase subunit D
VNERMWSLPIDAAHPAAHGGLRLLLEVTEDEMITRAEPVPGALHRGAEKLFESRDYRALLTLANRHDWFGSVGSECGLAELIERMLGIRVPPRASWLRLMLQEATRTVHHLLWLSATVRTLPGMANSPAAVHADRCRGRLQDTLEQYTGFRLHHMIVQPGGVRADCPPSWPEEMAAAALECPAAAASLSAELATTVPEGLAQISHDQAMRWSTSGPLARASGVTRDARWTSSDHAYTTLRDRGTLSLVVADAGDAISRFRVLADQVAVSAACVAQAAEELARLDGEPVNSSMPRSIRVPEGNGYHESENPAGSNGWYLESRGGPTPYRLFVRTASTNNAQAFAASLPGTAVADLPLAVMSALLLAGDLDK